jgi:hypothetical protein
MPVSHQTRVAKWHGGLSEILIPGFRPRQLATDSRTHTVTHRTSSRLRRLAEFWLLGESGRIGRPRPNLVARLLQSSVRVSRLPWPLGRSRLGRWPRCSAVLHCRHCGLHHWTPENWRTQHSLHDIHKLAVSYGTVQSVLPRGDARSLENPAGARGRETAGSGSRVPHS